MAIQFVQGKALDANLAITWNGDTTSGNCIVVALMWKSDVTVTGVTDSQSNTYVDCGLGRMARPTDGYLQIFVAKNITGGTTPTVTATMSGSTSERAIYVHEYSGVNLYNPVNTYAYGTATSGKAITTSAFTPDVESGMIFAAGWYGATIGTAPMTVSDGASYTERTPNPSFQYNESMFDRSFSSAPGSLQTVFTTDVTITKAIGAVVVLQEPLAVRKRYVNPDATGSGDGSSRANAYTSLNAALSALARDLTTANEVQRIICCSDGTADTTAVNVGTGWTTGVDTYIQIEAEISHGGKWNTSAYRLQGPNGAYDLTIWENYVRIIGLQVGHTNTSYNQRASVYVTGIVAGGSAIYIDKCIIRALNLVGSLGADVGIYNGDSDATLYITNTLIYDFVESGRTPIGIAQAANNTMTVQNCTIYNCYTGIYRSTGTINAYNCGVAGCTTAFSGTITQVNCSSSTPTFVDAANKDFHLDIADTTWRGMGANLSSIFTEDIDGDTRDSIYTDDFSGGVSGWYDITGQSSYSLVPSGDGRVTGETADATNHGRFNQAVGNDHSAWVTYQTIGAGYSSGVLLRVSTTAYTYYYVSVISTTAIRVRGIIDGSGSTVGSDITGFGTLQNGSRIMADVSGSTSPVIRVYVDITGSGGFVYAGSVTDTNHVAGPSSGNYAGLRIYDDNTNYMDDFGCGNLWDIGADQYTESGEVADVDITDAIFQILSRGRFGAESLGLTDAIYYELTGAGATLRTVADSMGMSDAYAKTAAWIRYRADNMGISDARAFFHAYVRAVANNIGLTDAQFRALSVKRLVADALGITDARSSSKVLLRYLSDAVGIADALSRITAKWAGVAESIGMTDAQVRKLSYIRAQAEAVGLSDAISRSSLYRRMVAEGIGVSDAVYRSLLIPRTIAESLGVTDARYSFIILNQWVRTVADTVGVTDSVKGILILTRNVAEQLGITDARVINRAIVRAIDSYMAISDTDLRLVSYIRQQAESVTVDDEFFRLLNAFRSVSDSVGVTDAATYAATLVIVRSIYEAIGISDARYLQRGTGRYISDNVGLSDARAKRADYGRFRADSVGITDAHAKIFNLVRTYAETIGITDFESYYKQMVRSIGEDVGVLDSQDKLLAYVRSIAENYGITDSVMGGLLKLRTIADIVGIADADTWRTLTALYLSLALSVYDQFVLLSSKSKRITLEAKDHRITLEVE